LYNESASPPEWFGIKSEPELENQINDRLSLKAFIGLPFSDPSPDNSSIICHFRERIGKNGLEKIFHEFLEQFVNRWDFYIESGLTVDISIIQSACDHCHMGSVHAVSFSWFCS